MIDNMFNDIDKNLAELFIAINEQKEYKFYAFGVTMSAIEKKLHNTNTHTLKRFTDYIYHLSEIFVEPYSIVTYSTVFDDKSKEVIQMTQSYIGGRPSETYEVSTYAEYVAKMLYQYGKGYKDIDVDECIETLKNQSTTEQTTYTSSYCSTLLKGLITYTGECEDINNTQMIADLYSKYFEFATPRASTPEQSLNDFRDVLLLQHNMNNRLRIDTLENETEQAPQLSKKIDTERLLKYFNAQFKGAGRSIDYSSNIIDDLQVKRSDKDMARIALLMFKSKSVISAAKGNTFGKWYQQYCDIVGCVYHKDYKPSNLKDKQLESLRKTFYYL